MIKLHMDKRIGTVVYVVEGKKTQPKIIRDVIDYLNCCSSESFYWISELFEDSSEHFKSQELIECMESNAARTGVDCSVDIEYAKKALD